MILGLLLALSAADRVILETPEGARQPQVAVGSNGWVAVVYGVQGEIHLSLSEDSGATFGAPLEVADAGKLALGMRRGPRVVLAPHAIVVTAIAGKKGGGRDGDLLAWRSTDKGKTWSGPVRVNDVEASAREGLHAMARDGLEGVYTAWVDLREERAAAVYLSKSVDGGATWSEDRLVYRPPSGGICECCAPSLACDDSHGLHVMFRNSLGGMRDMWVTTTRDGGKTFPRAWKLGTGTWKITTCPMDGGGLTTEGSLPRSVWRRDKELFTTLLSGPEVRLGEGVQPCIATGPGGDHILWTTSRGGALMFLAPGADAASRLDEAANDPVVVSAFGDGPVIAAWESGKGKDLKLVVQRLDKPR